MWKIGFAVLMLVCLVFPVSAGQIRDTADFIFSLKGLASVLGVSIFGLVGYLLDIKAVVKEFMDVVAVVQTILKEYTSIPEAKKLEKELVEALSVLAERLRKRPFGKRLAERIESLIREIQQRL